MEALQPWFPALPPLLMGTLSSISYWLAWLLIALQEAKVSMMARRPMGLEEGGRLGLPVLPPNSLQAGILVPAYLQLPPVDGLCYIFHVNSFINKSARIN